MIGEYKACDSCCHCIRDIYEDPDTKKMIKGEPLGCNVSNESRYQMIAQSNGFCEEYLSLQTVNVKK